MSTGSGRVADVCPNGWKRRQDSGGWFLGLGLGGLPGFYCDLEMDESFLGGITTWFECISMKGAQSARGGIYIYIIACMSCVCVESGNETSCDCS